MERRVAARAGRAVTWIASRSIKRRPQLVRFNAVVILSWDRCSNPLGLVMQKKLSNVGNSLGLIIEKPILELLRIDKDTVLDVSTDGEALIIRPLRTTRSERVRAAAERVADDHAETFEKLAK